MILKSNKIHRNTVKKKPRRMVSGILRSDRNVLTGGIILDLGHRSILKTVSLIGILLIIYISNSYWVAEKIERKTTVEKKLTDLRFRQIAFQNEVARLQKFSVLEEQLAEKNLKKWLDPPYHLKPTHPLYKTTPNRNNNGN